MCLQALNEVRNQLPEIEAFGGVGGIALTSNQSASSISSGFNARSPDCHSAKTQHHLIGKGRMRRRSVRFYLNADFFAPPESPRPRRSRPPARQSAVKRLLKSCGGCQKQLVTFTHQHNDTGRNPRIDPQEQLSHRPSIFDSPGQSAAAPAMSMGV